MAYALVVNAPHNKANSENESRSFEQILATGVAPGYGILDADRKKISIGCTLIILDKYKWKRAEATIVRFEPAGYDGRGIQRYNVHFKDARETGYSDESLNRSGTAIIDL
jgi:hypothetical protein